MDRTKYSSPSTSRKSSAVKWDDDNLERGSGAGYSRTPSPGVSRSSSLCPSPEPGQRPAIVTIPFPSGPVRRLPSPLSRQPAAERTGTFSPSPEPKGQHQFFDPLQEAIHSLVGTVGGLLGEIGLGPPKSHASSTFSLDTSSQYDGLSGVPSNAIIPENMQMPHDDGAEFQNEHVERSLSVASSTSDSHQESRRGILSASRPPKAVRVRPKTFGRAASTESAHHHAAQGSYYQAATSENTPSAIDIWRLEKQAKRAAQKYKDVEKRTVTSGTSQAVARSHQELLAAKDEMEQAEYEVKIATRAMMRNQAELDRQVNIPSTHHTAACLLRFWLGLTQLGAEHTVLMMCWHGIVR
jgi:hypothetical protein